VHNQSGKATLGDIKYSPAEVEAAKVIKALVQ
jgi:hypothetical protein